jgi:DNA modification methylase
MTYGRDLVNWLYYGDNLEILSRFISDESIDLVYLDPPFNKNAAYSVIFRDESGRTSDAQMATLEDYWHWGPTPARHYEYLTNSTEHRGAVPGPVEALVGALHAAIRPSPLLAYLVEMTVRLVELRRVLRTTGTIYLHCDPTNSHYLKLLLDAIFGPRNFVNEIAWKRSGAHSDATQGARHFGRLHDVLLVYAKSDSRTWNQLHAPLSEDYVATHYPHVDADTGRRYGLTDLTGPGGAAKGNPAYEVMGITKHWRYSRKRMEELIAAGRVIQPRPGAVPRFKRYLEDSAGRALQDIWDDIGPVNSQAKERLGYPTQKPRGLLDRIIQASSNPGDVVLDPFCGCGTAIESADANGRRWIGIDISNLAVDVIRDRMAKRGVAVRVFDWPTEMDGVRRMVAAEGGRRRFETWALARLGLPENRPGGDGGVDGRISFTLPGGRPQTVIVSVKSAHVGPGVIRDLKGTMQRERAVMGLLFTMEEPTSLARREAVEAGFYRSPIDGREYPKVTIHTVEALLNGGRLPDLPTRYGIQDSLWGVPQATVSVRLRSSQPRWNEEDAARPTLDLGPAAQIRARDQENTAITSEAPRSPRASKRDRARPLRSPE